MTNATLTRALESATETRRALVGRGVLTEVGALLREELGDGITLKIIADENTWRVAGEQLAASLEEAGLTMVEPLVFPAVPRPYASLDNAKIVEESLGEHMGIAVGSGTISDLVKVASFALGRDYVSVGTAASMDGYTGAGAPMSDQGIKVTHNCKAPGIVVMDLDVIAAAPASMTASGYGDLAAKIPGGADWILADVTGIEPVDLDVWNTVQSGVAEALSDPGGLAAGEAVAFTGLAEGLILSGLAMQAFGGTRPASGAEHYFSHLWELAHVGEDREPPASHGFKVAIGTLAMCAFYEALLDTDLRGIPLDEVAGQRQPWDEIEADIRASFDGALADHAVKETKAKYATGEVLAERLRPVVENWPEVAERLRAQLVPWRELSRRFAIVGTPAWPEDIGLTMDDVRDTFRKAMYYRSRYTALDVAWELGIFDQLVDDVFERIWRRS